MLRHRLSTSSRTGTLGGTSKGAVVKVPRSVLAGLMSAGLWIAPIAGEAQPALEHFRFYPSRLCLRDVFQWGFLYRGFPGGLAAVKDLEVRGLLEGRPVRSPLTPTRDDLQRYTADQGRFESHRLHWPRKAPADGTEFQYTLRVVLADGHEVTSETSVRYVDSCPPPPAYPTLAAGPTGPHRPADLDAYDLGVSPGGQARRRQPDLGRPRVTPGAGRAEPGSRARARLRGRVPARTGGRRSSVRRARRRSSSIASRAALLPAPRRTSRRSAAWP